MSRCVDMVLLADLAAGRLDARKSAKVRGHVDGCAACSKSLNRVSGARAAMREIAEMPAPTPSPAAAARMEAALRWTRTMPVAREPISRRWWFAAAGVGLCAATALTLWLRAPKAPPVVAERKAPVAVPVVPQPPKVVQAPEQPGLLAVVTLVAGDVRIRRGAEVRPLDPSTELRGKDQITTGHNGRVAMQWGEGSGALLSPSSELLLSRLESRAQDLRIGHGRVVVRVGPHQPGESLRVATPDHIVTVHGTWFVVAAEARGTTVEVLEGVVEVGSPDGSDVTRLAAPMRAFFPAPVLGAAPKARPAEGMRPMSAREAAQLRATSEMGLLPWSATDPLGGLSAIAGSNLVNVESDPPSTVAVDGVIFGATPLKLRRIQGRHLVELSRPGYATTSRWVSVGLEPGEVRTSLPAAAPKPLDIEPAAPDEVQTVVTERKRQVSSCYTHALKRDPKLAGTVTLRLRVGDAGQVLGTVIEHDTLADPTVAECLRREAAGWSFKKARNVTVVYPFVFRTP